MRSPRWGGAIRSQVHCQVRPAATGRPARRAFGAPLTQLHGLLEQAQR